MNIMSSNVYTSGLAAGFQIVLEEFSQASQVDSGIFSKMKYLRYL